MALIKCQECGKEISETGCGLPRLRSSDQSGKDGSA